MARSPITIENLSQQIDELKSELRSQSQHLTELARVRGKRAGDAAYSEGSSLYRSGEQQLEHLQSRAEQMSHQARDKVRQEPALALATALGVGAGIALLIGIVTSRK